jgi:hypothetical protein
MREWTFDNHPSGDGPWAGEPDKVYWVAARGLPPLDDAVYRDRAYVEADVRALAAQASAAGRGTT